MSIVKIEPFHEVYRDLLMALLSSSTRTEVNARTSTTVAILRGGASFRLDLTDRLLPTAGLRKTFPHVAAAELAWMLQGTRELAWLQKYTRIWDQFVDPGTNRVGAAYGHRWRTYFGRDQIGLAIGALKRNPSDRRVNITAWDAGTDGLGAEGQPNVPCPTNFTVSLLDGELHSALFLRSSDVFVGLPYDVMGHALLMGILASTLHVTLGIMHVTLAHAHLYQDHWEMADQAVTQTPVVPPLSIPESVDLLGVTTRPDDYVKLIKFQQSYLRWPIYSPKPRVVA